jgi:ribosome-binding protein aMBF1 (putative translation factor)
MRDDPSSDDVLEWYGERVGRRRAAAGMSQRALASWVGCHASTLSRIENGRLKGARLEITARIEWELARRRV